MATVPPENQQRPVTSPQHVHRVRVLGVETNLCTQPRDTPLSELIREPGDAATARGVASGFLRQGNDDRSDQIVGQAVLVEHLELHARAVCA